MKIRLCILGIPGSGKTSIAERLVESFNVPLYDVGAILRNQSKQDNHIASVHKEGGLVNSDRVLGIFEKALCEDSFILCGSPRKPNEAEFILNNKGWLENPGWLINLELDQALAKQRLFARKRFDDLDETILQKRFDDHNLYTKGSIELFAKAKRLINLDGSKSLDQLTKELLAFIESDGNAK